MALTKTFPTQDPTGTPITDTRRLFGGAVVGNSTGLPRAGLLSVGSSTGALVTGTSGMTYNVGVFVAATSRVSGGIEFLSNDATVSVATDPAPASNSRIDVVYARARFVQHADGSNAPEIAVAKGIAGSPAVKPAIPAGALELATIEVPANITATTASLITQSGPFTAMSGGVVPFRSIAEMRAWAAADGTLGSAEGFLWRRVGARWFLLPGQTVASAYAAPAGSQSGAGTLLIRAKSLIPVSLGQSLRILVESAGVHNSTAGSVNTSLRALSSAADVAYTTGVQLRVLRTQVPASSTVVSTPGMSADFATTLDNTLVSAGLFLASLGNGYGPDGYGIAIVSA